MWVGVPHSAPTPHDGTADVGGSNPPALCMGVQFPLWRPFQCAIGGTADTADLGSAASACGFKSLIAHHASIIQWPGSLPSKQMMRVRFPLDAPLGNSTTASASGSDPDYVCSIHTSPAIYGILVKSSRSGLEWFQRLPHEQVHEGPNPSSATIGGIAQLVERLLCKQNVVGSNPFGSTSSSNTTTVFR